MTPVEVAVALDDVDVVDALVLVGLGAQVLDDLLRPSCRR